MQSASVIVRFFKNYYYVFNLLFKEWLRENSTIHLAQLFHQYSLDKSDTPNKNKLMRFDLLRSIKNVIMSAKCKGLI